LAAVATFYLLPRGGRNKIPRGGVSLRPLHKTLPG
jgi:hypothetical protein